MDTNVLLWAAGGTPDEPWKVPIAQQLLRDEFFGLSAQSIAEFINGATRAKRVKLEADELDEWVSYLSAMPLTALDIAIVDRGFWMHRRYQIQYYDGALLAAAERLGVPIFYSDDLNDGQMYGDVRVVNPFRRH